MSGQFIQCEYNGFEGKGGKGGIEPLQELTAGAENSRPPAVSAMDVTLWPRMFRPRHLFLGSIVLSRTWAV